MECLLPVLVFWTLFRRLPLAGSGEGGHEGLNPQQHDTKVGGQGARGGDYVTLLQRHQRDAELDVVVA